MKREVVFARERARVLAGREGLEFLVKVLPAVRDSMGRKVSWDAVVLTAVVYFGGSLFLGGVTPEEAYLAVRRLVERDEGALEDRDEGRPVV